MRHFPVFHDLNGQSVLLVGGGEGAVRKLKVLTSAGAQVRIVSPEPSEALLELAIATESVVAYRGFQDFDVNGVTLVIGTDEGRIEEVARAAIAASIPVNIVDRPEFSTFITPSIVDRDPITVAISSGGAAPVLARKIRQSIEASLPSRIGRLALLAEQFRAVVATKFSFSGRRRFWQNVFEGQIATKVLSGDEHGAQSDLLRIVNSPVPEGKHTGTVHFVGAGPGDADLLTLRALQLLQSADIVVHDSLVSKSVLGYARRDAEFVRIAKDLHREADAQDQTNSFLKDQAGAGKSVVRLTRLDPATSACCADEIRYLNSHSIPTTITPGISAASEGVAELKRAI